VVGLTLQESQAIAELAELLQTFLPGKPHPYANQSISFPGVAAKLGLGQYWSGGSKRPALTLLLSSTLERERGRFCALVTEIVRQGITYRRQKDPLAREDIERLNDLVVKVGFKIPDLYAPAFLDGLPRRTTKVADAGRVTVAGAALAALQRSLLEVSSLPPHDRGFAFETFLNGLFDAYKLAPRGSFRVVGEQIDGSFQFHGETYLVEARWREAQAAEGDLLVFSGKVSGKAKWSRGLFISHSGFTVDGLDAFARGKATCIICMDGLDLYHVIEGKLDLREVLERKSRRAAETNQAFVPVRELFSGVI
jgi:hypothetical protein